MKVVCNLCNQEFNPTDKLLEIRKERHDVWHMKAWVHHRNTTQGIPKYLIIQKGNLSQHTSITNKSEPKKKP